MNNIKDTVRITKINGAQFLIPCDNYYLKVSVTFIFRSVDYPFN